MENVEIKKIQEQFNKVISYSQEIENPNTDKLFTEWLEAKRDFIESFGGKLIIEYPEKVSFELGSKEKSNRISDFIVMVESAYENIPLANFIEENKEGFFSNQVINDYEWHGTTIPKGMKLIKAFKFFETDEKVLNNLQSAASMIIQEDKIEGTLCLSVHPLDFISASENTHNWRSCHALDGDYRAGNLSYMVDSCTIMCYLKSSKEEVLPNFPSDVLWNSKKWRVWLFFSQDWDMMFAGRQYPFSTATGIDFVKDKFLSKAIPGSTWTPWLSKKIEYLEEKGVLFSASSPYVPVGNELIPMKTLVENVPGSLQFNDLLSSSCYKPVYSFKKSIYDFPLINPKRAKFKVGGPVHCICCGETKVELVGTMMCNDCELAFGHSNSDDFGFCACCGSRYLYDDGIWVENAEEYICPSCAESEIEYCSMCGNADYKNRMFYDRATEAWICSYCKSELDEERDNV